MKFKFSKVLNGSGVSRGGVHASKNDIEIDRFSSEDVVPFHVRKFWNSLGTDDFKFCEFKVEGVILVLWTIFLVSSWLGVRKVLSVNSYMSQGNSDSSSACFLADDP